MSNARPAGLDPLQDALNDGDLARVREVLQGLGEKAREELKNELGEAAFHSLYAATRKRSRAKRGRVVVLNGIMGSLLNSIDSDDDRDRIWLNLFRIAGGRMSDLALKLDGKPKKSGIKIRTAGLHKTYLPLLLELEAQWHVLPYAFDWRLDIDHSADRLARKISAWSEGEPVHLVAHSMGGLVARRFVQRHPDLWASMDDASGAGRGGRLVMLGTPNKGSFIIPLVLTGQEKLVKWLERIDLRHGMKTLLPILAGFKGMYQMLPSPLVDLGDHHKKLFSAATWGGHTVVPKLLSAAKTFQSEMDAVQDPERLIYVAGYDQDTVHRIRVRKPGEFSYRKTKDGDGRVPHELGLLEGVPTFWVNESHGSLPKNANVMAGMDDLLLLGRTSALESVRPARRGTADSDWIPASEVEPDPTGDDEFERTLGKTVRSRASKLPAKLDERARRIEAELLADYVGGGTRGAGSTPHLESDSKKKSTRPRRKLKVEVHWGDITRATGDVYCVGHYRGVLPTRAEAALDSVISGKRKREQRVLHELTQRGVLRGDLGDVNLFPWAGSSRRKRLVAVAGMGHPGTFTQSSLRRLAQSLAWEVGSLPDAKTICTVLIGSGDGGLEVGVAVRALVEGLARALVAGLSGPVECIRIVEFDLRRAHQVFAAVRSAFAKGETDEAFNLSLGTKVFTSPGGRMGADHGLALALAANATAAGRRSTSSSGKSLDNLLKRELKDADALALAAESLLGLSEGASSVTELATRIEIKLPGTDEAGTADPESAGTARMTYVLDDGHISAAAITDTAVVAKRRLSYDMSLVDELVRKCTDPDPDAVPRLSRLAHDLLVPVELREALRTDRPIVFEVDRMLARVHWEMLAMDGGEEGPLGLDQQVARQLRTTYSPPVTVPSAPGARRRALVIGDPGDPAEGDSLPGAREEAQAVDKFLRSQGVEVELRVGAPNRRGRGPVSNVQPATRLDVLQLLFEKHFDILHYSGHGDFDPEDPSRVGWVFSGGLFTAGEIQNLDHAPSLIVANACLSGRTSNVVRSGETTAEAGTEADLLPSLADEFFRRGVRDYVGTAWEVDDEGAVLFAETFYRELVQNSATLGASMLAARKKVAQRPERYGALWAAYQHYGDPGN